MEDYNGMIDYHGWIDINAHYDIDDADSNNTDLATFIEEMAPLISEFNNHSYRKIEYNHFNWVYTYHILGAHNHNVGYFNDLINICNTINSKAPGSFGLLYVRLPEHPVYWNQYRVLRLANGALTEHEDTLLSPCSPVIEP